MRRNLHFHRSQMCAMDQSDAIVMLHFILQTRNYTSGTYFPWDNRVYSTATWWRYKIWLVISRHWNTISILLRYSRCANTVVFVNLILNQLSNDPQTSNQNTYFLRQNILYITKYSSRIWPITLRLKYLPICWTISLCRSLSMKYRIASIRLRDVYYIYNIRTGCSKPQSQSLEWWTEYQQMTLEKTIQQLKKTSAL